MKTLLFTLSMPNVGSWNGRWSGAENLYAVVHSTKDSVAERILSKPSYYYNFGDGWGASIKVEAIDGKRSREVRKKSKGFCGYNWMVDSILRDGVIYGPTRPKPEPVAALAQAQPPPAP